MLVRKTKHIYFIFHPTGKKNTARLCTFKEEWLGGFIIALIQICFAILEKTRLILIKLSSNLSISIKFISTQFVKNIYKFYIFIVQFIIQIYFKVLLLRFHLLSVEAQLWFTNRIRLAINVFQKHSTSIYLYSEYHTSIFVKNLMSQ